MPCCNTTFHLRLGFLALMLILLQTGIAAAPEPGGALSARLLVGPYPDVPAFQYPIGVEATYRLAWYEVRASGVGEQFERGPGWAVWTSASLLVARPVEEVFGPTVIGIVALQTGPSFLVGRALGSSLAIDLGAGPGYYGAAYSFVGEGVFAYRPLAQAHLVLTMLRPAFGLRIEGGYTVFIEEQLRSFAAVAAGIAVPLGRRAR